MVSGSGLRPRIKPQSGSQAPDKPKGTKTVKKTHTLRDQWFAAALKGLKPLFADIGYPLTAEVIRISAGFPSKGARSLKSRRIGECWDATAIADGVCQIYISPVLVDPVRVLGVLVHELVHAAVGCKCGHKGPFRKAALAAGLTGKMTATDEGPALVERLTALSATLGPYPHAALDPSNKKKQGTRMLKAACESCDYIVRLTRKMIDLHGCPICPSCQETMVEESV